MKSVIFFILFCVFNSVCAQKIIVPCIDAEGKRNIDYTHVDTVYTHIRGTMNYDFGKKKYNYSVVTSKDVYSYKIELFTEPSEEYFNDGRSDFFAIKVLPCIHCKKSVGSPDVDFLEKLTCILDEGGFLKTDSIYPYFDFGPRGNRNYIKIDMNTSSLLLFAGPEWFPDASMLMLLWLHKGMVDMVFNDKAEIVNVTQNDEGYLLKLHEGGLYFDDPKEKPKCSGIYISKKEDLVKYYDSYPAEMEKSIKASIAEDSSDLPGAKGKPIE